MEALLYLAVMICMVMLVLLSARVGTEAERTWTSQNGGKWIWSSAGSSSTRKHDWTQSTRPYTRQYTNNKPTSNKAITICDGMCCKCDKNSTILTCMAHSNCQVKQRWVNLVIASFALVIHELILWNALAETQELEINVKDRNDTHLPIEAESVTIKKFSYLKISPNSFLSAKGLRALVIEDIRRIDLVAESLSRQPMCDKSPSPIVTIMRSSLAVLKARSFTGIFMASSKIKGSQ